MIKVILTMIMAHIRYRFYNENKNGLQPVSPISTVEKMVKVPNAETLEAFAELESGGGYRFSGPTEQLFAELMEE